MISGADTLADLVLRHRDSPSPVLHNRVALLRLLDEAGCDALLGDLTDHAQPWEMRKAGQRTWETVPDEPGLYMFVWRPFFHFVVAGDRNIGLEQVLYLGQAGAGKYKRATLRSRYKSGYSKYFPGEPARLWEEHDVIQRHDRLQRYLSLRPLEFWFAIIEDRDQIAPLEDRLLQLLNPLINRNRRPKLVRGAARPAFARD